VFASSIARGSRGVADDSPWLDAFVVTASHIIGIESKRYEPFRCEKIGTFSPAYWRKVWGKKMGPFERMRDQMRGHTDKDELPFKHLDAVQLVKHAFGLRTESQRRSRSPALIYLYSEPTSWPDGRPIERSARDEHAREAATFGREVEGAEVVFRSCTYKKLLSTLLNSSSVKVRTHGQAILDRFAP
jgi:hypothetical protein